MISNKVLKLRHIAFQDYVLNDALFRVFDEDDSGTLNFFEWFQASNVKNMATIEEKLNWIFTAFDADGGGSIDSEEIMEIVKWMFRLAWNSLKHDLNPPILNPDQSLNFDDTFYRFAGIDQDPDLLASCVIDVRSVKDIVIILCNFFNQSFSLSGQQLIRMVTGIFQKKNSSKIP